jgi:hypothetical protein
VDSYSFEPQSPQHNHVKTEPSTSLYSISKHHLVAGNTVHYPTSTTFSTTLALKLPPRCLSSTLATGECPLLPGRVCLRGLDYRPELHRMPVDPSTDCVSCSPVYAVSDPQAVGCRTGVLGAPVLGSTSYLLGIDRSIILMHSTAILRCHGLHDSHCFHLLRCRIWNCQVWCWNLCHGCSPT